jgi:protoheme IX farnesyltransferase
LVGVAGSPYFVAALLLGAGLLVFSILLARQSTVEAARHLVWASLVYLPILLLVLALDRRTA